MHRIILALIIFSPALAHSQFSINFHQSNLPFAGLTYEIKNRWRPELRLSTDVEFDLLSPEVVVLYDLVNKEDYELYIGAGGRANAFSGVVFPLGLNIYPLPAKQFGLHIELAPIIGDNNVLRGSWGIHYRFLK